MSAETARRLSCDAGVVAMIEDDNGEPLSVGRKTRTISSPLRRFLKARDNGCRFPGCTNTRHVDAHHIKHWAHGGETKPSNLVSLCSFHHRRVHEGGIEVQMLDDGAVRFIRRDGRQSTARCRSTEVMARISPLLRARTFQCAPTSRTTRFPRWRTAESNASSDAE
jgi:hypothetical protein